LGLSGLTSPSSTRGGSAALAGDRYTSGRAGEFPLLGGVATNGFNGDLRELRIEIKSRFTERFALRVRQWEESLRSIISRESTWNIT
jgi:hypothetical protein